MPYSITPACVQAGIPIPTADRVLKNSTNDPPFTSAPNAVGGVDGHATTALTAPYYNGELYVSSDSEAVYYLDANNVLHTASALCCKTLSSVGTFTTTEYFDVAKLTSLTTIGGPGYTWVALFYATGNPAAVQTFAHNGDGGGGSRGWALRVGANPGNMDEISLTLGDTGGRLLTVALTGSDIWAGGVTGVHCLAVKQSLADNSMRWSFDGGAVQNAAVAFAGWYSPPDNGDYLSLGVDFFGGVAANPLSSAELIGIHLMVGEATDAELQALSGSTVRASGVVGPYPVAYTGHTLAFDVGKIPGGRTCPLPAWTREWAQGQLFLYRTAGTPLVTAPR